MKIICYGTRGSIPVSGPQYNKYGGNTTCFEIIGDNNEIIILDAGTGIRELGEQLKNNNKEINIIFTHYHFDHIAGLPFFLPMYLDKNIKFYGAEYKGKKIDEILGETIHPPFFPVPFTNMKNQGKKQYITIKEGDIVKIGNIKISAINLSHPDGGLGYRIENERKSIVFITDNELGMVHNGGHTFDDYVEFAKNADYLIHDGEYTDEEYEKFKSWGHSTANMCLELAKKANVKKLSLAHYNRSRSDEDIDKILKKLQNEAEKFNIEIVPLFQNSKIII
jgi:phosphoribosyl 1,2-cyclic phosphodiesterase